MKSASDMVQGFEYARRDLELEHLAEKYDNRDVAVRILGAWATAQNSDKIASAGMEVPTNDPPGNMTEGYATALER